jgi:hypothetical protein
VSWTAHYFDPTLNASAITRPCTTKEDALRMRLDAPTMPVEFIEGPESVKMHAVEIAKWCKLIQPMIDVHRYSNTGISVAASPSRAGVGR